MDPRAHRFTRRSALVAAAATLLGLAALGGTAASAAPAAPSNSGPVSSTRVVGPGAQYFDLSTIGAVEKRAVKPVMRYGSCSPEMMDR